MIKNIIFDMGRVLINFNTDYYMDKFCVPDNRRRLIENEVFRSVEWVMLDRGEITFEDAFERMKKRLPEDIWDTAWDILYNWSRYMTFVPGMEEVVKTLKDNGYKLYVLSNISKNYKEYLHKIPAIKYFDGKFLSCDWRLLKPETEIYRACISHFGINPAESIFIDDLPVNIEAGERAGITGIIFNGDPQELKEKLRSSGVNI